MKKIIIATLAIVMLSSCGAPKIKSPSDALKKNQNTILKKLSDLEKITPEEGNSKGTLGLSIITGKSNLNSDIKYDFDFIKKDDKFSGNIEMKFDTLLEKLGSEKISANASMDLMMLKDKILFKLNKFNIENIEKIPQLSMVTGIVSQFQKKWYFIGESTTEISDIYRKNPEKIYNILKKNTILEFVKENKNKDFYDYDVKLNSKNIYSLIEEFTTTFQNQKTLTEENKLSIKKLITEINKDLSANIKIDKTDLKYFILNINSKNSTIKIENSKKNINILFEDKILKSKIDFIGKKIKNSVEGTIKIQARGNTVLDSKIKIKIEKGQGTFEFGGILNNQLQKITFNINLNDVTVKKVVKIEEPKNVSNFEDIINIIENMGR